MCEDRKVDTALVPCGHTACQECVAQLAARPLTAHHGPQAGLQVSADPDLLFMFGLQGPSVDAGAGPSLGECYMCRRPYVSTQRVFLGSGL